MSSSSLAATAHGRSCSSGSSRAGRCRSARATSRRVRRAEHPQLLRPVQVARSRTRRASRRRRPCPRRSASRPTPPPPARARRRRGRARRAARAASACRSRLLEHPRVHGDRRRPGELAGRDPQDHRVGRRRRGDARERDGDRSLLGGAADDLAAHALARGGRACAWTRPSACAPRRRSGVWRPSGCRRGRAPARRRRRRSPSRRCGSSRPAAAPPASARRPTRGS